MESHECKHSPLEVESRKTVSSRLHSGIFPKIINLYPGHVNIGIHIATIYRISVSEDDMGYDGCK